MQFSTVKDLFIVAAVAALTLICTMPATAETVVLRVDIENGEPDGDGSGWNSDAFRFLQDALQEAEQLLAPPSDIDSVDIWVAQGTYRPDQRAENGLVWSCAAVPPFEPCPCIMAPQDYIPGICCPPYGDCDAGSRFVLRENVAIYGGFSGDGWENDRDERDWEQNITILSGDLEQNSTFEVDCGDGTRCIDGMRVDQQNEPVEDADCDTCRPVEFDFDETTYENNSRTIVWAADGSIDQTAVLDGFHIRHGVGYNSKAIYVRNANPTIENCVAEYHVHTPCTGSCTQPPPAGVISVIMDSSPYPPELVLRNVTVRHNLDLNAVGFDGDSGANGVALLSSRISNNLLGGSALLILMNGSVVNSEITGNDLTYLSPGHEGAAVYVFDGYGSARIWNSLIADNISDTHGGGSGSKRSGVLRPS